MAEYIIYRHGWNEVNQNPHHGLPKKQPVLRVEADSPEEACRLARPQVLLLGDQYLTAELAEPVDAKEDLVNRTARGMSSET
jgi:hypothetical protein